MSEQSFDTQALPSGFVLGKYTVGEVIGEGGFGVTYKGKQQRLDRQVAIKEYFPQEFAVRDPETFVLRPHQKWNHDRIGGYYWGKQRFLKEAKTLAKLDHRNIVSVIDYEDCNNTAYMMMSFVAGATLSGWLEKQPAVEERQLLKLFMPLLDGLAHVHAQGISHRDIKPDNILISADGQPILIDFGSSRETMGGDQQEKLTILVTPGYAPEEQYDPDGKQGPWTDIYAIGATMFYCITGAQPQDALLSKFSEGNNSYDQSSIQASLEQLQHQANTSYSSGFLAIVKRCLEPQAENRYQSAEDLIAALAQVAGESEGTTEVRGANQEGHTQVRTDDVTLVSPQSARATDNATELRGGNATDADELFERGANASVDSSSSSGAEAGKRGTNKKPLLLGGVIAAIVGAGAVVYQSGGLNKVESPSNKQVEQTSEIEVPSFVPSMVSLAAGSFNSGCLPQDTLCAEGEPRSSSVAVAAFEMSAGEVTVSEFEAFVEESGYKTSAEISELSAGRCVLVVGGAMSQPEDASWRTPGFEQDSTEPVVCVSHRDATAYTQWLSQKAGRSFRLPSETEWEYAARGGDDRVYPWGDTLADGVAVCSDCKSPGYRSQPASTDAFESNGYGLYHMSGNVWEWVGNVLPSALPAVTGEKAGAEPPSSLGQLAVLKGGSWFDTRDSLRISKRESDPELLNANFVGFRVAADL